jgi:hypothetical protein
VTHLGKALEVDPKYEENHLFVRTTTDTPGYRAWLSKLAEYREVDDLRVTEERTIPIRDGVLELRETLAPNSTLFVEIEVPESPAAANLLAQSWQTTGQVKQEADGSLRLTPAPNRSADASLQLGQLVPGAAYTLVLEVSAPVRVLDAIARLEGRETAQGRVNYDPGTRRIVLTAKADADGQLRIRFEAPAQPWEPADRIQIRKAELRPAR